MTTTLHTRLSACRTVAEINAVVATLRFDAMPYAEREEVREVAREARVKLSATMVRQS